MTDKADEKQLRLFETTRDLVLENGIQGASMAKISKLSKLPMGTIYSMYPAKEDLVNATYVFCRSNYLGKIDFAQCQKAGDRRAVVRAAVLAYIDAALAHDKDFLFVEQCYLDPIIRKESTSDGDEILNGFGFQLSEGSAAEKGYLIKHMVLSVINKAIELSLMGRIPLDDTQKMLTADACWSIFDLL